MGEIRRPAVSCNAPCCNSRCETASQTGTIKPSWLYVQTLEAVFARFCCPIVCLKGSSGGSCARLTELPVAPLLYATFCCVVVSVWKTVNMQCSSNNELLSVAKIPLNSAEVSFLQHTPQAHGRRSCKAEASYCRYWRFVDVVTT